MIPEGLKVNKEVYVDMLASKVVPWVNEQQWDHGLCLQADGAPAHTANKTQEWCKKQFQHFWSKEMWPLPLQI